MTYENVLLTLMTATKAYGASIGVTDIAYPNKSFTPPDSGFWLEMTAFPNPVDPDLNGNYVAQRGIWQINVCARKEIDPSSVYKKVDELLAIGPEKGVTSSGITITTAPKVMSQIQLDDRFILPITIEYSE